VLDSELDPDPEGEEEKSEFNLRPHGQCSEIPVDRGSKNDEAVAG